MTEASIPADEMDAILDDALDALDDSDSDSVDDVGRGGQPQQPTNESGAEPKQPTPLETAAAAASSTAATMGKESPSRVPFGPPRPPPPTSTTNSRNKDQGDPDQAMEDALQQMFRDLAKVTDHGAPPETTKDTTTKNKPPSERKSPQPEKPKSPPREDAGAAASDDEKMLQDLFQGLMAGGGDTDAGNLPNLDEIPDLDNLFAGLGGEGGGQDGGNFNADDFMNGMMEQLLSKDLMYEPMKQVTEKFPAWLASKKSELPAAEWDQRNRQFECFRRLVSVYEGSEQPTDQLMEIMQEIQEYGQPPAEIISEIAPELELDGEGLPKLNGLPPFLGGGSNNPEDCRIM